MIVWSLRCEKKGIIATVAFAIIVGLILLFFYPLYTQTRPHWPEITEENKEKILQFTYGLEEGPVPRENWIEALKEMNPQHITFENGILEVILSGGGIGPGWGYLISKEEKEIRGVNVLKGDDPRFKRFRQMH